RHYPLRHCTETMDHKPVLDPSSYPDTFARDHLPAADQWPAILRDALPECRAYPERLNCAEWLSGEHVRGGRGERAALHYEDVTWSYAALEERANRVAGVLREELGLVPGNRVLLRGLNTPMLAACWLGVLKAGGICVTTIPMLQPAELAFVLHRVGIRHALCEADFLGPLEQAAASAGGDVRILSYTALGNAPAQAE